MSKPVTYIVTNANNQRVRVTATDYSHALTKALAAGLKNAGTLTIREIADDG